MLLQFINQKLNGIIHQIDGIILSTDGDDATYEESTRL